mmetsp:Transcript_34723/g.107395  ORF Transcript_34723/g.107395 Transcript_34723/m.107395 type:complete len:239 (+) Transcript_34723:173-889(+)
MSWTSAMTDSETSTLASTEPRKPVAEGLARWSLTRRRRSGEHEWSRNVRSPTSSVSASGARRAVAVNRDDAADAQHGATPPETSTPRARRCWSRRACDVAESSSSATASSNAAHVRASSGTNQRCALTRVSSGPASRDTATVLPPSTAHHIERWPSSSTQRIVRPPGNESFMRLLASASLESHLDRNASMAASSSGPACQPSTSPSCVDQAARTAYDTSLHNAGAPGRPARSSRDVTT